MTHDESLMALRQREVNTTAAAWPSSSPAWKPPVP